MVRAAIAVCLAMLTTGLYSDTPTWALELPSLSSALNDVSAGLQMIEQPLTWIEQNMSDEWLRLQNERQQLSEAEQRLDARGLELNARDTDLRQQREFYDDLKTSLEASRADLDAARKETRKQLWRNRLTWAGAGILLGVFGAVVAL